jgi:hypothetical protein
MLLPQLLLLCYAAVAPHTVLSCLVCPNKAVMGWSTVQGTGVIDQVAPSGTRWQVPGGEQVKRGYLADVCLSACLTGCLTG